MNDFAKALYDRLSRDSAANLVFSPASVTIALAMTRAGAGGETAAEMDRVLHIGDVDEFIRSAGAIAIAVSNSADGATVSVVNSLWAQTGYELLAEYVELVSGDFGAAVGLVDYSTDADGARREINAWVNDHTRGRIEDLLPDGSIHILTRLTLVNAIYLKASWSTPFAESNTRPGDFTRGDGQTVTVPTMHLVEFVGHAAGPDWRAVELHYQRRELSLLVAIADPGASLNVGANALLDHPSFEPTRVHLALPRFETTSASDLVAALTALGMPAAFDEQRADFSAMTSVEQIHIGGIVHHATITVDEHGTEAAAATAVMMAGRAAPTRHEEPIPFVVDRPFAFAIRHNPTGAVLFLGKVGDPGTK